MKRLLLLPLFLLDMSLYILFAYFPESILAYLTMKEKPFLLKLFPGLNVDSIHFYGIRQLPPENSIFEAILSQNINLLRYHLKHNHDREYNRSYTSYCDMVEDHIESDRLQWFRNKTWNGMVAMEVAILMEWKEGIELLRTYKRNMVHEQMDMGVTYGNEAVRLAEKFHKKEIAFQLYMETMYT